MSNHPDEAGCDLTWSRGEKEIDVDTTPTPLRVTARRALSLATATAMLVVLAPLGTAFAQATSEPVARGTDNACDGTSPNAFPDDDGSFAHDLINCMAEYGITVGNEDGTYGPGEPVTRAEMATFIARTIESVLGEELPAGADAFDDDDESVHEPNIDALAAIEVVSGNSAGDYEPNADVSRGEMAAFIRRGVDYIHDDDATNLSRPPDDGNDYFADDETSSFEAAINRLAGVGIVTGYDVEGEHVYLGGRRVIRSEMAAFVMRGYDYTVSPEFVDPGLAPGVSVTDAPELISARTDEAFEDQEVVRVEFTFDEAIDPDTLDAEQFHLYRTDTNQQGEVVDEGGGLEPSFLLRQDPDDPESVDAVFSIEDWELATVAAVTVGAVTDVDGVTNPEGSAPLQSLVYAAGATAAPDLTEVSDAASAAGASFTLDFTFDDSITTVGDAGLFEIVLDDGVVEEATDVSQDVIDDSVVTATFDGDADGTAYTPSDVRRGVAEPGAAEGDAANPLQTVDVLVNGDTTAPDLDTVTLDYATDQATFVFDEDVVAPSTPPAATDPDPADFSLYDVDGVEVPGASIAGVTGGSVTVQFAAEDVTHDVVGASAATGAVTSTDTDAQPNAPDEVGIPQDVAAGATDGPVVESVVVEDQLGETDPLSGQQEVVGYQATFTFDQAVAHDSDTADQTGFAVYNQAGERYEFVGGFSLGTGGTSQCQLDADDATKVVCSVGNDDENAALVAAAVLGGVEYQATTEDDRDTFPNHEQRHAADNQVETPPDSGGDGGTDGGVGGGTGGGDGLLDNPLDDLL